MQPFGALPWKGGFGRDRTLLITVPPISFARLAGVQRVQPFGALPWKGGLGRDRSWVWEGSPPNYGTKVYHPPLQSGSKGYSKVNRKVMIWPMWESERVDRIKVR
ncbi:hypothetical protein B9T62_38105 [Paenibacillus donghaensis]|uniref:Uncharacterized protein n=1 Tax=Paenibacillus donghaensis TaxID=414771 RepID=A0A2Z2KJ80_9BACL|nr:hypothetical protein B9T62_38105 [Paenibacillus donghaensis]